MRIVRGLPVLLIAAGVTLWAGAPARVSGRAAASATAAQAGEDFQAALIQPQQLLKELKQPRNRRPIVLQVGFQELYRTGHIPGAIYAGPAYRPEGLAALRKAAERIPRTREVVIYCGCCPLNKCPNIHPAYAALKSMGFRRLRVLDLPNDMVTDWIKKGLPVVKGMVPR